jgi:hypothetical protein
MELLMQTPVIWTLPLPLFATSSDFVAIRSSIEQRLACYETEGQPLYFAGFLRNLLPKIEEAVLLAELVEQQDSERLTPFLGWSGDYATLAGAVAETSTDPDNERDDPLSLLSRLERAHANASAWETFQSRHASELQQSAAQPSS